MTRHEKVLAVTLPLHAALKPDLRSHGTWIPSSGLKLTLSVLVGCILLDQVSAAPARASIPMTLIYWTPLLAKGFLLNVQISFCAMGIGTVLGLLVGLGHVSTSHSVRHLSWLFTQVFRNAPGLILLFYCSLLLPSHLNVGGLNVTIPDWVKGTIGLSLPVTAFMSELVRGAIQSIPTGQWDSAESLAFTRLQTLRVIILPQCVKRILPPWMNIYAVLATSTPLCSIIGVSEVMTLAGDVLSADSRRELLLPLYSYVLIWFFAYCYPIARLTSFLERRFAVND